MHRCNYDQRNTESYDKKETTLQTPMSVEKEKVL